MMVLTYSSLVSATIDVTSHTTFYIDIGSSSKGLQCELVIYWSSFTTAIDILINVTTL